MACNPVKFSDLGKDAKDLLEKNFHFGVVKIEGKTKSKSGVAFATDGVHNTDTGNITGSLELKVPELLEGLPLTMTEKWNTGNVITQNFSLTDKPIKGAKTEVDVSWSPTSGKKSAKVKTSFAHDYFHSTHDIDLDLAGPVLHGSAVAGYNGILLGGQASYDTGNSKFNANSLSLAYHGGDYRLCAGITDLNRCTGLVYHKVSDKLNWGAILGWSNSSAPPSFTAGAQYRVDQHTFYKAKIDVGLRVGLSYVTKLCDGVQVTLSTLVNAKAFNGGGHKVGLSLNLDA